MTKSEAQAADYRAEASQHPFADSPGKCETGEGQSGMRTERVTLEITHSVPVGLWDWTNILETYRPGESVRVVEEFGDALPRVVEDMAAEIKRLDSERDAAIQQHSRECVKCSALADKVIGLKARVASLESQLESVACRAATAENRVAELESAAKLAPAANAADGSNHAALATSGNSQGNLDGSQAASGAAGTGVAEIARLAFDAGFGCSREGFNGECAYEHLAPTESTFDGDDSEPYEKLKRDSVAKIMSEAASGAASSEPVAWMCEWADHTSLYDSKTQAEIDSGGDIVPQPLYRSPPPARGWLTEEEREAVVYAAEQAPESDFVTNEEGRWIRETLTALLARSSPPEVVAPASYAVEHPQPPRDLEWLAALAAAGVTCKEVNRE